MKKQTNRTKQTKMATEMTRVVARRSRWQRFWGIVALVGLFLCGYMLGGDVQSRKLKCPVCPTESVEVAAPQVEEAVVLPVCAEVERLMLQHLPNATEESDDRIDRAKIYAKLSERGCPENAEMYIELARAELDIARAIEDDEFDHEETIDVVETYKRIHMQAAAEEIFEKAKKLTNPAIDFILQVEKIINE